MILRHRWCRYLCSPINVHYCTKFPAKMEEPFSINLLLFFCQLRTIITPIFRYFTFQGKA